MKKKLVIILLGVSVLLNVTLIGIKLLSSNNDIDDGFNDLNQVKHEHTLSMMLEQNAGAGDYSLESRSTWPTKEDGYVFNSTLSKCEKGSKLRWDDENNAVVMVGTTSDKCYVYFDKYSPKLAEYVIAQYTGTQGENNLYYHDSTLANGAGDNSYRYAGSSSTTNNYVCFGSDNTTTCPDDNLYRIIGVFGDQVKLIKWDYANSDLLGTDGDDSETDGYCSRTFSANSYSTYRGLKSIINTYQNNNYYCSSTTTINSINLNINFINSIGAIWENKIVTTTWKVGGNTWSSIGKAAMNTVYQNEIISPAENTSCDAKIGLIYVTDYGYAADSIYWAYPGAGNGIDDASNDYRSAIESNWMYMGLDEWTIVSRTDYSHNSFQIDSAGNVGHYNVREATCNAVRPVFYLNSDVTYISGTGTKSDPIRIN